MAKRLRLNMKKIAEYIQEMDEMLGVKTAFVPASAVQGGGGGAAVSGKGGQPQQGGAPQQQGQPQQGGGQGGDPNAQMMQAVMQMVQGLPPEVQQQAQQAIQQVQSLPPDQQGQALQQIAQGLQQMSGQGGQGGEMQSTIGGDPAAAAAGGDPSQGQASQQPGAANTAGHVRAENELDSKTVTLSVRELMDITSGGSATKALLAVKQLADTHNTKMQQNQQKLQMDQQKAQVEQQMAAQGMGGGGLYAQAPDMSGKNPQAGGGGAAQPAPAQ